MSVSPRRLYLHLPQNPHRQPITLLRQYTLLHQARVSINIPTSLHSNLLYSNRSGGAYVPEMSYTGITLPGTVKYLQS